MIIVSAYHPIDTKIYDIPDNIHIVYKGYKNINSNDHPSHVSAEWEPNIGSNIFTTMRYISENYYTLPEKLTFIKSNIFSRHISFQEFNEIYDNNNYCIKTYHTRRLKTTNEAWLEDKWYCENYNEWFRRKFSHVLFQNAAHAYSDLLNSMPPSHFRFSPGANFSLSRSIIQSRNQAFYERVTNILGGAIWPREAHIIERMIGDIFEPK